MANKFEKIMNELKDLDLKNIEFELKNMTYKDMAFSKYLYTENKPKPESIKFDHLTKEIVKFYTKVKAKTNRISVMDAKIKSSEVEDELIVDTLFKYHKYYLSPLFHQFLSKPNCLILRGNRNMFNYHFHNYTLVDNPPHLDSHVKQFNLVLEDELSLGIDYKNDTNKKGLFIQNTLFLFKDFEFLQKLKYSVSNQDIKRNKDQRTFKLAFSKSFYERPFVFRDYLVIDPLSKLNFQYAHKIIDNSFDETNSSIEMNTEVPRHDSLHQFKISLLNCKFLNYKNFLQNEKTFIANNNVFNSSSIFYKISSSYNHTINNSFFENKLFLRRFFNYENLLVYQFNLEGGAIINTNNEKKLKIPENFFIRNFKGIDNPGEKVIVEEGKTGDCLGNNYYLINKNKFIYNNIPILNNYTLAKDNFEISPFVFLNFLYCGNSNNSYSKDYERLHYSTGFGLNVLTETFNIELYYNLFVKKNKNDISSEFSVNIGLD